MADSFQDKILIDKYLQNKLSQEEKKLFAKRMLDPRFSSELEEMKSLQKAIQVAEKDRLKEILRNGRNQNKTTRLNRRLIVWSVAAVVIAMAGISLFFWQSNTNLYDQYYQAYPNMVSPITKGQTDDINAYQYYELKNYRQAIELLKDTLVDPVAKLYFALSHLALDETATAKLYILELSADPSFQYREAAIWYTALIYLKDGDKNKSINYLNLIRHHDSSIGGQAQKLWQKLQ